MYSHEDGFLQATTLTYIMGHNKTVNYDTISKRVSIYLCMSDLNRNSSKKFKISFEVVRKCLCVVLYMFCGIGTDLPM